MEALQIIAGSWPIAIMVVGVAIAFVVRRSIKQVVDVKERRDEYYVSQARQVARSE